MDTETAKKLARDGRAVRRKAWAKGVRMVRAKNGTLSIVGPDGLGVLTPERDAPLSAKADDWEEVAP